MPLDSKRLTVAASTVHADGTSGELPAWRLKMARNTAARMIAKRIAGHIPEPMVARLAERQMELQVAQDRFRAAAEDIANEALSSVRRGNI